MKILYYGESPAIETGGGQVSKHLVSMLAQWGEIEIVPINHLARWEYDRVKWPHKMHYADSSDMHNKDRMIQQIGRGDYDLLFLTGDINILDCFSEAIQAAKGKRQFQTIVYAAIDCNATPAAYFRSLSIAEYPIVYSDYAHRVVSHLAPEIRRKVDVIGHGTEPDIFYPLPHKEREEIRLRAFGCEFDDFLVVNVNRNQVRKDLARSMAAFHLFHINHRKSKLYLHAKMTDSGGHLPTQASMLGLNVTGTPPEIIFAPPGYNECVGVNRETLNGIYNAADVVISTSTGEGWGLTTTEAMAAGRPIIGPRNTTFPELLGVDEDRGYLVQSGGVDLWSIHYEHSNAPREMVSVSAMAQALEHVLLCPMDAQEKAESARRWAVKHSWASVMEKWEKVLCKVQSNVQQPQMA